MACSVSSFEKGLGRVFGADVARRVCREYRVVGYDNGNRPDCTLFPSIDRDGKVLGEKVQWYYDNLKCDKGMCYWRMHSGDCLFGEHLLKGRPDAVVGLVESPKNAVVCRCKQLLESRDLGNKGSRNLKPFEPLEPLEPRSILWVATGNKGLLKREMLEPLRGRRVIVLPDVDARVEWMDKLAGMRDLATFHLSCLMTEIERLGPKADVADWILLAPATEEPRCEKRDRLL